MTYQTEGYRIGATVVGTRGGAAGMPDVVGVTRRRDRSRYLVKGAASGLRWWAEQADLRIATAEERQEYGLGEVTA
ncbi:hypothetical protein SMD11_3260 [Streptomyces albireticuli]|uniref:Uncharacterized protein n=1 Tax=Streptomyces albireticuli TaxID=1940 RepID=A0A1Z2L3M4_9ACTN|nr:hypothetical protein [Streptomyces albireticuli]ARZ68900.1 hypothetical protein SMD11_3260 [Streptomyces albireticuli]